MSAAISVTRSQLLAALRGFLLSAVDVEVVQAQDNRVAMPDGPFITMTDMGFVGLSTNRSSYHDPGAGIGTETNARSTQWNVQLDFYGEGAADLAATVAVLVRSEYACRQLANSGMQPLYAGEPRNTTLLNGEQQYEERWTLEFSAQCNPSVTTPMDFADELVIQLAETDVTFPPEIDA